MSLLDDVSIVVTPNGYKAGELYAVVPVPTEGSEEIINGDFATDSDWNKGTGITISGGSANFTGNSNANINQNAGLVTGTRYRATFTISNYVSGDIDINVGGNTRQGSFSANGDYTIDVTNVGGSTLFFQEDSSGGGVGFTGSISNVSLKELTSADMDVTRATAATRVDEDGLVNYAEVLGDEDVTNVDFTQTPLGTGWDAYTSGSSTVAFTEGAILSIDGSNSNVGIYQQNIFTSGVQYKIVVSVKATASFDALVSETDAASSKGTIGTLNLTTSYQDFCFYYTGTGDWDLFIHRKYGETAGQNQQIYVKSVSVKEVTRDNVPRIDYTGGGCPHILAEPQRTNLITYSEDFIDSSWIGGQTNASVTASSNVNPSGENGTFLVENVTGTQLGTVVSVTAGQTYTGSFYVRNVSGSGTITLRDVNNVSTNFTATDEWQRFSVTGAATGAGRLYINVLTTGDIVEVWGAQLEQGSYATSYIPTSGSTVTRNQDIFARDGIGSLINSEEGVLFAEIAALSDDGTYRYMGLTDANADNRVIILYYTSSTKIRVLLSSGGTKYFDDTYSVTDITDFHKVALKWKVNDFALWIDGVERAIDTSGSAPIGLNTLALDQAGSNNFFGKVKQLQVYTTALSDEQLLQLTGESGTDFYESYAEMASALTYTIQ